MREAPVLSISLVAALLLAGCERSIERFLADSPPESSHAVVTRIELKTVDSFYEATGTVQSRRKVTISAKIAGVIASLRVKEGDNVQIVQKGDTIDLKRVEVELIKETKPEKAEKAEKAEKKTRKTAK